MFCKWFSVLYVEKASTKHLEPLLIGIFLVCCKKGWSVVLCMLLVWHLGTTSALSVLRLDFSVSVQSVRREVLGGRLWQEHLALYICTCVKCVQHPPSWCYQILTGLGLVSANLGSIPSPSLGVKVSLMHFLLLGCSTQSPVVLSV